MKLAIDNLSAFIENSGWFRKLYVSNFGIILPTGWVGKPGDERYLLESARIEKATLFMKLDWETEIELSAPKAYEIYSYPYSSKLTFFDCQKIVFKQDKIQTFTSDIGNNLSLDGFFTVADAEKADG